ncbi:MAG: DUF4249 family protein [Fimbriimonadaceae bacterium]|nr:DUF4249 family protein [Chitinophagales bacterium]
MKRWLFAAGMCAAFLFQDCSTDFDLNADFKESPVIYALLSQSDSIHYIRINRAFLNDEIDAITMASDPNEIYYGNELTVKLEELIFGGVVDAYLVERVNGDTLGIPKNTDGIFASAPNILYRFKANLNAEHVYRITVTNTETGITAVAETPIIDSFKITRPNDESIFPQSVTFSMFTPYEMRWISAIDAKFYDLSLRFHYRDRIYFPAGDSFQTTNSGQVEWKFAKEYAADNTNGGFTITYDVSGPAFYNFIKENFSPVADDNLYRFADSVQFIIDAGGQTLYDYMQYNNSTLGLTEGQVTDPFTNVVGGLGVFSTRFHKEGKIYPLQGQTIDSIACGSITGGLNFATDNSNAFFPDCE